MHPSIFKPFTRKLNIVSMLAGLLTYSLFTAFPSFGDSGMENEQVTELTATGIVPEFHRASLLIPIARKPNQLQI